MSKTYILYPKVLKGQEAEEWRRSHLNEWQRLHDYPKITPSDLPQGEVLE